MLNGKLNKEMAVQKMNQLLCEYSSILQFVQKTYLKVTKEEKGEICVCVFLNAKRQRWLSINP